MPRGRAGLWLIPAADVRAAIARWHHSAYSVAAQFGVAERTVRRWKTTGLPLTYGKVNISMAAWESYAESGKVSRPAPARKGGRRRTSVDQHLSARSRAAAGAQGSRRGAR